MMDEILPDGPEALLATLTESYQKDGATREVAVLSSARAHLAHLRNDPVLGDVYCLWLRVPPPVFEPIARSQNAFEESFLRRTRLFMPRPLRPKLEKVSITPTLQAGRRWREQAQRWLDEQKDRRPLRLYTERDLPAPADSRRGPRQPLRTLDFDLPAPDEELPERMHVSTQIEAPEEAQRPARRGRKPRDPQERLLGPALGRPVGAGAPAAPDDRKKRA